MKCGMCMCLAFLEASGDDVARLVGGYEDGSVAVWDANPENPKNTSPLAVVNVQGDPVMAIAVKGRGGAQIQVSLPMRDEGGKRGKGRGRR